jgi:hypothetical protein
MWLKIHNIVGTRQGKTLSNGIKLIVAVSLPAVDGLNQSNGINQGAM